MSQQRETQSRDRWLVHQTQGTGPLLVCFPEPSLGGEKAHQAVVTPSWEGKSAVLTLTWGSDRPCCTAPRGASMFPSVAMHMPPKMQRCPPTCVTCHGLQRSFLINSFDTHKDQAVRQACMKTWRLRAWLKLTHPGDFKYDINLEARESPILHIVHV